MFFNDEVGVSVCILLELFALTCFNKSAYFILKSLSLI